MRSKIIGTLMLVGLFATFTAVSNAQIVRHLKTNVPFSFAVGNTELPAGEYVISYGVVATSRDRVIIRSVDGTNAVIAYAKPEFGVEDAGTSVNFETVNGKNYLSGVSLYGLKFDFDAPRQNGGRAIVAKK